MKTETIGLKLFKMLHEWRKTKSIALASEICQTLLTNDGEYDDEDLDAVESEMKAILYGENI